MSKRKRTTIKQGIRHRISKIPVIPQDILLNILILNSPKFLHNVGKFVCKSWATIIYSQPFIHKHLSDSIPILIFNSNPVFYIEYRIRDKRLQVFNYEEEVFDGELSDSSVGLILYDDLKNENLFLRNPITRQILKLPSPIPISGSRCKMNVTYLSLTEEFKVICNYRSFNGLRSTTQQYRWSVLTVGATSNMSWRMLDFTTSLEDTSELFFSFSVGGVVIYWTNLHLFGDMTFFAVDLHDESFLTVHVPSICDEETLWNLIPMGRELYVISVKREDLLFSDLLFGNDYRLRVWRMRDFRHSEWIEVFSIKVDKKYESFLNDRNCTFIAWYENDKILVYLTSNDRIMAHNFELRRSYFITKGSNSEITLKYFFPHTNSLFRFRGDLEKLS